MINQPKFLKVQDEPGLVRDTKNNAILANNLQEKKKYLELQKKELNISRIGEMNERIEKLENGVNEILINNGRSS
jgi:hypothetical protein